MLQTELRRFTAAPQTRDRGQLIGGSVPGSYGQGRETRLQLWGEKSGEESLPDPPDVLIVQLGVALNAVGINKMLATSSDIRRCAVHRTMP
jgi:hypothetical protein